ncbi:hypothetical protein ABH935_001493 [Catenulispora sp. GAS73]|uniref:ArnT family glycosyltransferase n=1 Tax=Catenulispora sp. GAS73 TaxID=3156269 RepID=UPI00351770A8
MFQLRGTAAVAVLDEDTQSDTGVLRGGWERSTLILLGFAAAIGIGFPFLVSAWTGSLSIPHNDSWCFSRAVEIFARTGRVHLFNWNSMALVGQFIPLWKAGRWILVQDAYIGVLAVVALWAVFDILRAVGGRRRAAVGVLVLVCWPGFGLLSTSFMTDIPALAAVTVTLAIGRRALDRASVPLFLAASVTGFWGFTIREQAIAAIVGVYVAALWKRDLLRPAKLAWLLGFGTTMAVGALVFEHWRRTVPNAEPPAVTLAQFPGWHYVLFTAAGGWLYLALALSPVVVLTARPWAWSRPVQGISLVAGVWFAYEVYRGAVVLPQNYLQPNGAYSPAFLGLRANLFPRPIWDLLLPLGCLASALLIGLVLARVRTLRKEVLVFALVTAGSIMLELSEHWILFDRYLLPLTVPLLAIALHRAEPIARPRIPLAALAGALLAGVTGSITVNALTFDAATWHTAQSIVAGHKASADHVDAGLDWTAWHSPDGKKAMDPNAEPGIYVKSPAFGHDHPCYVVAASPQQQAGWTLDATPEYRRFGFMGPQQSLYVYRTAETVCH